NRNGDVSALESVSDRITTAAQLCAFADVDLTVWEITKQVVNKWESPNKDATRQLFQVKVWLKRKVPERVEKAIEAVLARLEKHRPQYGKEPKRKRSRDPHMLEFSPFDMHIGMLAWREETGDDYDLSIAERTLAGAVADLLGIAKNYPVESFLFPVGSDWFHVENLRGETVRGTPQDTDGRWAKIFEVGYMACVNAVDAMREVAPVRVLWVGGNHDWTTSWYLVRCLKSHYREVAGVTVTCQPTPRHYVEYGATLLGLTHGDEEKHV
ncbi:unnamed protein product, partial [marine sediment metagenome]